MNQKSYKGVYRPENPSKYVGNTERIVFRSLWERKVMIFLDRSPHIIRWASEEFAIPYPSPVDGKIHRYFPDFWVETRKSDNTLEKLVIEVKPYCQTKPPNIRSRKQQRVLLEEAMTYAINQAKWKAAEAFCKKHGWKFAVWTEKEIRL